MITWAHEFRALSILFYVNSKFGKYSLWFFKIMCYRFSSLEDSAIFLSSLLSLMLNLSRLLLKHFVNYDFCCCSWNFFHFSCQMFLQSRLNSQSLAAWLPEQVLLQVSNQTSRTWYYAFLYLYIARLVLCCKWVTGPSWFYWCYGF